MDVDFSLGGVDENEAYTIQDGQTVIDVTLNQAGGREPVDFIAKDENGNDYFLSCIGFAVLNRFGKDRLYFAVRDLDDEKLCWYTYYIARRADGTYLLVHETDDGMHNAFAAKLDAVQAQQKAAAEESKRTRQKRAGILHLKLFFSPSG